LKRIYEFLNCYVLEKLEEPCDHCDYWECEKNVLNEENIIRKKYKWNDIDWKECLKYTKKEFVELMEILRHPEFKEWSYEPCKICKKKLFKHDMEIHMEISKKTHLNKEVNGKSSPFYFVELFHLCKKCNRSYVHRKNALHKGFEKF